MSTEISGCGAPAQGGGLPPSVDVTRETVISGVVRSGETPVAGAYVRLLDATGEFAGEVVTSAEGQFRFFTVPGSWTLRALSRFGNGDTHVLAERGLNEVALAVQ